MITQQQIIGKIETINLDEVRCNRCNGKLTAVKSIARGMGKRCEELDRIEKSAIPKSDRELRLTSKKQKDILNFVKDYIKPKTRLFETSNTQFNYIWGLEDNIYYQNTYYYTKYETNNLEKILKSI